jgi:hypothetical protein
MVHTAPETGVGAVPQVAEGAHLRGRRRLIAGLRVSEHDAQLLALVAPFFPEADSAGDLAYRLWRRGLELTLAELAGLGVRLPPELADQQLAILVVQRLLLCLPLLRRTNTLAVLQLEAAAPAVQPAPEAGSLTAIDATAATTVAAMGSAFL